MIFNGGNGWTLTTGAVGPTYICRSGGNHTTKHHTTEDTQPETRHSRWRSHVFTIPRQPQTMEDTHDQINALLSRELHYQRSDYLGCFMQTVTLQLIDEQESDDDGSMRTTTEVFFHTDDDTVSTAGCSIMSQDVDGLSSKHIIFGEYHRERLCEWAAEVVQFYDFPMDCVEIAMSLFDRFLANHVPPLQRTMERLHLITLASLYLTLKLHTPQRPSPETFVRLSRCKYSSREIERTEMEILHGLGWLVSPPTAETFLHYFVRVLRDSYPEPLLQKMKQTALDSLHRSYSDYMWIRFRPSVVALGALCWGQHSALFLQFANSDEVTWSDLSTWYPSPLAELHRHQIYVHPNESMECLEHFHRRESPSLEVLAAARQEPTKVPGSVVLQERQPSPVSILSETQSRQDTERRF